MVFSSNILASVVVLICCLCQLFLVWGLVKLGGRVCGLPVFLGLLCGFICLLSYECCAAFRFGVRKIIAQGLLSSVLANRDFF